MAEGLPLSEGELQLLESLLSHKVRFLVVGLRIDECLDAKERIEVVLAVYPRRCFQIETG